MKHTTDASRPKGDPAPGQAAERHDVKLILVPIDFSASSLKAMTYAVPFARRFGGKLVLLHVVEPIATPDFAAAFPLALSNDQMKANASRQLRRLGEQLEVEPELIDSLIVRLGRSYHEITETARAMAVDMIIISTHGHTGLKHVLFGSTTERVVRHAPCPVLVVREHEKEFQVS